MEQKWSIIYNEKSKGLILNPNNGNSPEEILQIANEPNKIYLSFGLNVDDARNFLMWAKDHYLLKKNLTCEEMKEKFKVWEGLHK